MPTTIVNVSSSLVGVLILALDLVAIFEVFNSSRDTCGKVGWFALIFFFPVFGVLAYFLFGRQNTTQYEPIAA
ncbi:hypothetical protein HDU89_000625 [Geranomyces variabilis]|nr:hypothetical protein HDU89_000625 [Geranomyces variabilis]